MEGLVFSMRGGADVAHKKVQRGVKNFEIFRRGPVSGSSQKQGVPYCPVTFSKRSHFDPDSMGGAGGGSGTP